MDDTKARELLDAERRRVERLIAAMDETGAADRTAADQPGDMFDSAEPLITEGGDDAVRELEEAVGRRREGGTAPRGRHVRLLGPQRPTDSRRSPRSGPGGGADGRGSPLDGSAWRPSGPLVPDVSPLGPEVSRGRLSVLGIGQAPPPVGLGRDLIRPEAPSARSRLHRARPRLRQPRRHVQARPAGPGSRPLRRAERGHRAPTGRVGGASAVERFHPGRIGSLFVGRGVDLDDRRGP